MTARTILTMSILALAVFLSGCCEHKEPPDTAALQQYPCKPYCFPKAQP